MPGSQLFQRNRALGYVSNQIPACVRYIRRRRENVIVTCIGRSFLTYSSNHFRLICVSGIHAQDITCIASDNYVVYAASNKVIYAWRSGNVIKHTYTGHERQIHLLLPFGEHLISVDEESVLKVWLVRESSEYLSIPFDNSQFKITAIMHPSTYMNKIVIGSEQGKLELWNIKKSKLIYQFNKFPTKITILEGTPCIDVIAIGLLDGSIILLNLIEDTRLLEFKQDWGPVTGITFRTDGPPIMVTASTNGMLSIWNLDERKCVHQLHAHDKSITTVQCFPTEPLILTTSPDNSMKLWIFDLPDGGARLLRIREGHAAPPLCIRYHGLNGHNVLSAGEDSSLRIFSTVSETLNKSMGKASYNRKASKKKKRYEEDPFIMPPITNFTTEITREKEWDNIAAIHSGLVMTSTWSFYKSKMGELKLIPEKFYNKNRKDFSAEATCLCLTHCGNFVIIGYSSGDVERFNIQSGIHRFTYGSKLKTAHKSPVRGVSCDNLNQFIVTAGGFDGPNNGGLIKFWNFNDTVKRDPIGKIELEDSIAMFRTHRESALLCVILDTFIVLIIDCDTKSIIRKFSGHTSQITDACFSPDGRWLITASLDCTIKVWDIPSSYMIDHFKVENACISMTMSPTGDFLATAHVNYLGLYLWANKTLFSHVALHSIDPTAEAPTIDITEIQTVYDQSTIATNDNHGDDDDDDSKINNLSNAINNYHIGEKIDNDYKSPIQLHTTLITMSDVAISRWQNLLNLDIIKKRNKPRAGMKKPKQAPFFLPTLAGPELRFDGTATAIKASTTNTTTATAESSKIIQINNFNNLTKFSKLLLDNSKIRNYQNSIDHIKSLGPSMIDFEIKSLDPDNNGGNIKTMLEFMNMIEFMLKSNANFELAQTYLAVFLKSHTRTLIENQELKTGVKHLEAIQLNCWQTLEKQLLYGLGVTNNLRNFTN